MSWGGRGREDETRERMIDAARRSGMSVSELVQALAEGSPSVEGRDRAPRRRRAEAPEDRYDRGADRYERGDVGRDRDHARDRGRDGAEDIDRQLDVLADRLRNLSTPAQAAPARPRAKARDRAQDATLEEIAATVDRLSRKIPEPAAKRAAKAKPQTDVAAILTALDGLDQRLKTMTEDRTATDRGAKGRAGRRETGALGDLDRAIAEISQRQTALDREKPSRRPIGGSDLDRHFRELSEKIEQLRLRDEAASPTALLEEIRALRQSIEQRSGAGVDVGEEIRKLAGRIDALASQNPERATLEPLMTEMGRLRDVVLQSDVEGSLKSLEAGYGHIVDRLDELKRGLASPRVDATVDAEISEIRKLLRAVPQVSQFSSIEDSLRALSGKVERLATDDEDSGASRIERRIAELKAQIDRIDPAAVVKSLDQRLKLVTDKLDSIEKASRGPVTPDRIVGLLDELRASAAGSGTAEEMRALESRLAEISERIADLDRRRPSFDDTDRLHDRIAEIAGKLDRMAVPVTDRRTVDALETTIARLDEMMSRQSAPVPAGMIDGRVADLIERLDRGETGPASGDIEALSRQISEMRRELTQSRSTVDLETQMRTLAERLERSQTHEPDDEALTQIEEQLAAIARQLEANEDRFDGLIGIEGSIRRLGERMEEQQSETIEAAREAAREMIREFGQNRGEPIAEGVLRALQDDLKSLRSAARDSETRTADTLISLHDALTGIVGRLTAIERIAQGSARAAAGRGSAETPAQAAAAPLATRQPAPPPQAPMSDVAIAAAAAIAPATTATPTPPTPPQPTPGGGVASAIARAREALSSAAAEDTRPLEPGSGKPVPRPAMVTPPSPTMKPSAVDTAPPPLPGAASGEASPAAARKADFIAAARRAAQAAATATTSEAPLAARAEDRTAGIAAETEESGAGALSRIGQVLKNRRRPLVLATGALVLAFLTLRLIPGGGEDHPAETAELPKAETLQPTPSQAPAEVAAVEKAPAGQATTAPALSAPTKSQAQAPSQAMSQAPAPTPAPGTPTAEATSPTPVAAGERPQALVPGEPTPSALSTQLTSQRTSALSRPAPDATLLDAPAVTGSIGADAGAQKPAEGQAEGNHLPIAIGSERLRHAAEGGDPRAAFEVGMRYAEGRGVPADPAAAAQWYAFAADSGLVPAKYRMAVALEKGIGVPRDTEKAKRLYKAAAEAGNVRAMHNLGVLYANARDIASALPWFQKAADLGLKDSQFNLGIIHALGSGVKQDLAVSYKWFALAARQGDKEAEKKQTDVASHLDKVNLAAARMAVQTWVQKPLDHAANEELQVWNEPKDASKAAALTDHDMAVKVQGLLKSRGLYGGALDGQIGAQTRAAIKTFQKKMGQAPTGTIDADLIQLLAGKSL